MNEAFVRLRKGRWLSLPLVAGVAVMLSLAVSSSVVSRVFSLPATHSSPHYPTVVDSLSSCPPPANNSCIAAAVGVNWTILPSAAWCTEANYTADYPNGSYSGTSFYCDGPKAAMVELNVSRNSTLNGTLEITGPSQVWVLSAVYGCNLYLDLARVYFGCPAPIGSTPWYLWNSTLPSAGPLNLSTLKFNFNGEAGVLPPQYWQVWVVDVESAVEMVTVTSAVYATAR
ncbi:MAG: hypothetical protein L3K11_03510 [Thermoplasmata archaeon]|nr:hypothetical protein [Thermoplasmata archaeon]